MINYENLVFEGGGVKGIAYGGALEELNKLGILSSIRQVAGTSAGAITATLMSVGFDVPKIKDLVAATPFSDFKDDNFGIFQDIRRLLKDYGFYKGDFFEEWLKNLLKQQTGNPNYTFRDLANDVKANKKNYRYLYIVATNLSKNTHQVFSHKTFPHLKISDAVRMSMSIPLFFKAVKFPITNDIFVDGGLSYNYPLNLFDENNSENPLTLGLRLDSTQEITRAKNDNLISPKGKINTINNLKDFSLTIIDYLMDMANSIHLSKADYDRSIMIDTLDIGATDFDISELNKKRLMESGIKGVKDYFEWKNKQK